LNLENCANNSSKAESSPSDLLLAEIETFLIEMSVAPSAFGIRACKSGHLVPELRRGRKCGPKLTARVRAYMRSVRDGEAGRVAATAASIARQGGFITFKSDGEFELIPDGAEEPRLRRMIAAGLLVPSGDSMFGTVSQTYKLSVLAP
jgi:hypothetical protein